MMSSLSPALLAKVRRRMTMPEKGKRPAIKLSEVMQEVSNAEVLSQSEVEPEALANFSQVDLAVQRKLVAFQTGLSDIHLVLEKQAATTNSQLAEQRAYLSTLHQEIMHMITKKQKSN
jgi:hypothetical protein